MTARTQLEYYAVNRIDPVPIALDSPEKWSAHVSKRRNLYERHLGIPLSLLRGQHVLEFGCNSGENALVLAHAGACLTLVEPNAGMHEKLTSLFAAFGQSDAIASVSADTIESFPPSTTRYDVVIAEGFLCTLSNREAMLDRLFRLASPGGIVVTSYNDSYGMMVEALKRALLKRACALASISNWEDPASLHVAQGLFLEGFSRIPASRPFEAWWQDMLICPFITAPYFWTLTDLLPIAERNGFGVLGSSPRWDAVVQHSWYKAVPSAAERYERLTASWRRAFPVFLCGRSAAVDVTPPPSNEGTLGDARPGERVVRVHDRRCRCPRHPGPRRALGLHRRKCGRRVQSIRTRPGACAGRARVEQPDGAQIPLRRPSRVAGVLGHALPLPVVCRGVRTPSVAAQRIAEDAAEAVARYLSGITRRTALYLYGCGGIAQALVRLHASVLRQHDVRFVTSDCAPGTTFHGHPVINVNDLDGLDPERIITLSGTHQEEMLWNLRRVPRDRVLTLFEIVDRKLLLDTIVAINRLTADGTPLVCLAAISSFHHFLKLMLTLKKQGYRVLLALGSTGINNALDINRFADQGYFDYLYVGGYAYARDLLQILRSCRVEFVHAVASMADSTPLAALVAESPCPVFVEYADFKQLVFEGNDELAMGQLGLSASALAIEKDAQRTIYTRSSGIIIKDSPEIIDHLEGVYQHRPNWLHYFPYSCDEFSRPLDSASKRSKITGATHVVFAGCIHNDPKWHPTAAHRSTLRAIQMLTDQGIYFSLFNGMDPDGAGYEEYLELARTNPYFEYHFAVPYDELTPLLSAYDFGWFCFDYVGTPESSFFHKTTFGSKIFTYIEAGLPILVSPEVEYMCRVVEELGVGLTLPFGEIPGLSERLRQTDMGRLMRGVARVREELSTERQIPRLVEFYKTASTAGVTDTSPVSPVTAVHSRGNVTPWSPLT